MVTAALAAPALAALPHRQTGDKQRGKRVEPPKAKQCVSEEADQDSAGEVGAEDVLCPLAGGRSRSESGSKPELCATEQRHQDQAADGELDTEVTRLGLGVHEQLVKRVADHVGDEQPDADRDRLLCSAF